jgi:hypothetical protein
MSEVNLNQAAENYFEECDRTFYFQITYLTLYVRQYGLSVLKLPLHLFPQHTNLFMKIWNLSLFPDSISVLLKFIYHPLFKSC